MPTSAKMTRRKHRIRYYAEHPAAWVTLCRRALHGPAAWGLTWFHLAWIEGLQGDRYLLIAPRGYAKSSVVIALEAWRQLFHPGPSREQHQTLMVCDNDTKAREFADELEYIYRSALIQRLLGGFEVERRGDTVDLPAPPHIPHLGYAPRHAPSSPTASMYTVLSGRTGMHIDHGSLILDDAYVSARAYSEAEQERRYKAIHSGWLALTGPQTRRYVTGTRYTPMDHYQTMMDRGVPTNTDSRSAIRDDGTALWPEVWPLEKLAERRKELGEIDFQLQYQNNPRAASGNVFTQALIEACEGAEWPKKHYIKCRTYGVDLNYGGKDRSAVVEAVYAHGRIWLRPRLWVSYDEGQDHDRVRDVMDITHGWRTYVEANGPQKINVDILTRAGHMGIEPVIPRAAKEVRARELRDAMNRDEVRIYEGHEKPLTEEMLGFTGRDGDRDDLVDAAVMAYVGVREWVQKPGPQLLRVEMKRKQGAFSGVFK